MTIEGFGIGLVRLRREHIEMLRQWRNDERINRFMDYRQHISAQQQEQWFNGLDNATDFYFLIRQDNAFHGLIHFSAIDWKTNTGQSGLFICDPHFQGTHLPVAASALLLEYFFTHTPLQALEAKVMCDNEVALRYNLRLGFRKTVSEQPERYHRLLLRKDDFHATFAQGLDLLRRIHGPAITVHPAP